MSCLCKPATKLDIPLEVEIPPCDHHKCGFLFHHKITCESVVFDVLRSRFVAKKESYISIGEKIHTKKVFAALIRERVDGDEMAYQIIASWLDFNEEEGQTITVKTVNKLKKILEKTFDPAHNLEKEEK